MVDKLALVAELIVLLLFFIFGVIYVAKNPSVAHFSFEASTIRATSRWAL